MAIAISRTDKRLLLQANTPDLNTADWFIITRRDPEALRDFENLYNVVPTSYWKMVDGPPKRILEMDAGERETFDNNRLHLLKSEKVRTIDRRTNEILDQGFEYPPGSNVFYSMSAQAQINMTNLLMIKDSPILTYPIKYNSKNDRDAVSINTPNDIVMFYQMALSTLRGTLDSGTALKDLVRAATNKTELDLVVDPR